MSNGLALVLGLLAGLAVGSVAIWALLSPRLQRATAERERLAVERDGAERRNSELTGERDAARAEALELRETAAELGRKLATAEADGKARVEEMTKKQAELEGRFKEIAAEVSEATRDSFMKEFRDLTTEQTKTAGNTVKELVEPMRERLAELQKHVDKADTARAADTAKVSQSVDKLVSETSGLRQILRDSKMRGAWGEQHLRNAIEAAGMSRHIDYIEQATIGEASEDGRLRPDVVVKVPGGASVVIDAKTPFAAFDRAAQATEEAQRQVAREEHAAALRDHAKTLGSRDYGRWVEGSPDFVLMYLPTDPMLDEAMEVDAELWQQAWQRHHVLIATPGLLIAFLRTVALAWQQHDIDQNAKEVAKLGNDLYSRLSRYVSHVDKMGRGLRSAVDAYNDSVGSFERMVLPQARRFRDLGSVAGNEELSEPNVVELDVRAVNAPELESGKALESGEG